MTKKIFSLITLIIFLFSNIHNITNATEEKKIAQTDAIQYDLYKKRVSDICDNYLYKNKDKNQGKIKQLIKIDENYPEIVSKNEMKKEINKDSKIKTDNYSLPNFKNIHKTNMNNIYKCAILEVQQKSLLLIKKDLINKNPSASKKIGLFVDINLNRIDISMNSLKCIDTKDKSSIQKLNVLAQTTYQTCKYVSYLEYLKDYNTNLNDILPDNSSKISIAEITEIKKEKNDEINAEIKHTYKVFPLVFHAYTEYENNITIHFLLELVKEDYEILRAGLHKALNPINQVVYKISNIMKK